MRMEDVTVEDCMEMKKFKDMISVINDGKLIGFEYEKSTDTDGKSDQC